VLACPPSAGYRLRKFLRRHRRPVATAALLGVTLLAVAGSVGWAARDQAARRAVLGDQAAQALGDVGAQYRHGSLPNAWAALQRAEGFLDSGGGGDELRRRVDRWRADLEMVDEVERIRLEEATFKDGVFDTDSTAAA